MADMGSPHEHTMESEPQRADIMQVMAVATNLELKLVTGMALWAAQQPLPQSRLYQAITQRAGDYSIEEFSELNPYRYTKLSFDKVGLVTYSKVADGNVMRNAVTLNKYATEFLIPLFGYTGNWGLRYPAVSTQQIIGPSNKTEGRYSVETRLPLLEKLLAANGGGIGIADTLNGTYRRRKGNPQYEAALNRASIASRILDKAGIITMESISEVDDRTFKIVSADAPPSRNRGELSDAIYTYIGEQTNQGIAVVSYDSVLRGVLEVLKRRGSGIDEAAVRQKLSTVYNDENMIVGLQGLHGTTYNNGKRTRLFVADQHRSAVEDMVAIVDLFRIQPGPQTIHFGKRLAWAIINSPSAVARLLNKSHQFSTSSNADTAENLTA